METAKYTSKAPFKSKNCNIFDPKIIITINKTTSIPPIIKYGTKRPGIS